MLTSGPKTGYLPNAAKCMLIVKEEEFKQAKTVFQNSDAKVTKTSESRLSIVTGTDEFKDVYVKNVNN